MEADDRTLYIAEVPFESGAIHFRYSRYPSDDRARWIRHGLFVAYYENGAIASEGNYEHGLEHGPWHDYHPTGHRAAEGAFVKGRKHGLWRFWSSDGREEEPCNYSARPCDSASPSVTCSG
jgi:hypothetical protein